MSNERTEKATPKRREDALKQGRIARSAKLPMAVVFLVGIILLKTFCKDWIDRVSYLLVASIENTNIANQFTVGFIHTILINSIILTASPILVTILGMFIVAGVGNFIQGGIVFTPQVFSRGVERFNPISNLKRVFGPQSLVDFTKNLIELAGVCLICYGMFVRIAIEVPPMLGASAFQTLAMTGSLIYGLSLRTGIALVIFGAIDYGYTLYKHEKSLKMTKQEIKQEFREQEGDPLVKGQRRRSARALAQRRSLLDVKNADVVITNPTHFAVALKYDREKYSAPMVLAKGADLIAQNIKKIAMTNDIVIFEDPPLARALYKAAEPGQVIPNEFFRAIAEVLAYVYKLKNPF